jgi:uncharacterized iron-regulated membrane protein
MNLIRTLHAWTGALVSRLLIITGLTGGLLAFKTDFIRASFTEARTVVAETPQVLGAAANAAQARHGPHIQRIEFAGPDLGVHQLTLHGGYEYDAADGRPLAEWAGERRPETFVYDLHHFLLMGDGGMKVVGFGGLIAGLLGLTGLIVWAPTLLAWRPRLWPRSTQRRDLIAAHRNIGALFLLPIVLFSLTGAGLIFFRTTQHLLSKAFPGQAEEQFLPPAYEGTTDWVKALAAAQAAVPNGRIRMAIFPPEGGDAAIVRMKTPDQWTPYGNTEVLIDPRSSTLMGVQSPPPKWMRLYNGLYPLHTGKVGGWLYKGLTALSGLALAALGVFGLWSFLIKPRRRKRPTAP